MGRQREVLILQIRARPPSLVAILYSREAVIMPGTIGWLLREGERIIACNTGLLGHKHLLIGITRVRNEALILRDTLDYVGKHVAAIVACDDASTDRTLEIRGGHRTTHSANRILRASRASDSA